MKESEEMWKVKSDAHLIGVLYGKNQREFRRRNVLRANIIARTNENHKLTTESNI